MSNLQKGMYWSTPGQEMETRVFHVLQMIMDNPTYAHYVLVKNLESMHTIRDLFPDLWSLAAGKFTITKSPRLIMPADLVPTLKSGVCKLVVLLPNVAFTGWQDDAPNRTISSTFDLPPAYAHQLYQRITHPSSKRCIYQQSMWLTQEQQHQGSK